MFAILFFIIIILLIQYLRVLKRYVREIIFASTKVSEGDFSVKLKENLTGDLGNLTKNFNYMLETIKNNIWEFEDKNSKLQAILKSISSGIIAIDNQRNILLMNESAKLIFDYMYDDFEKRPIEEIIKNKLILQKIDYLMLSKDKKNILVEENNKYFNIKVDTIKMAKKNNIIIGSLINIEDITEKKNLEKMRSDFVANVTHELKTPLTSISGFVETLRENEDIDILTRNRFLGIIDSETNRLKRLIDDILMLSFIESDDKVKTKEIVNLNGIIQEVLCLVSDKIKDKNINIKKDYEELSININRDYLKQIILNLIDNAIKYNIEGGNIYISIVDHKNYLDLVIEDSGIGIAKKDLNRVFERFYRVDKARSKKIGGTGLGLAIVKHIVLSIGGNINVDSKLGKGTQFNIRLPKNN
ncbi:MAG: ATP-binding protein [Peptostreptococcaceae bacterium]|nr:ATP-binding protein [Peptostreptococcaceae bacterium]